MSQTGLGARRSSRSRCWPDGGIIFTLQGVGVLGGSVMSGVTFWAVAGPVIAVAGLAITAIGLRRGLAS